METVGRLCMRSLITLVSTTVLRIFLGALAVKYLALNRVRRTPQYRAFFWRNMRVYPFISAVLLAIFASLCTPQFTVPPDVKNCKLNYTAPFSWVVMIHDSAKKYTNNPQGKGGATQGVMLTYKSILTTATYFIVRRSSTIPDITRYTAVGHRIWDWRSNGTNARTNPCSQTKKIKAIHFHPKAQESAARRFLFDYAIILMEGYFNVTPPTFPTVFFPNSPYEMILLIQYVNVKNDEECAIPIPDNETLANREKLIINRRIDFATIKFHRQCVDLICEMKNGGRRSQNCVQVLQNRPNATMLCAYPANHWTDKLPWGPGEVDNPYAGTPYTCNGSTLGLVTQHKRRGSLPLFRKPRYDFFVIVTFLRVWTWLITKLIEFSPQVTPLNVPTASLKKQTFKEPYKEPFPYETSQEPQKLGPFRYPHTGLSSAPDVSKTIPLILNAVFVAIRISV